jgi:hypothetical protein
VPVGGYGPAEGGYAVPAPRTSGSAALGLVALVLSLAAAVVSTIIIAVTGYQIGYALPSVSDQLNTASDLSFLSPVRDQVLWAEIATWGGAILGIAAIVFGIIAIVKRRGRGLGIAALIIAVIAPVVFVIVGFVALSVGASAGAVAGF